ncbi:MAG: GNAT family N-acetyltransferase [Chloroflexi bacterium]|nr:MAG: GNAT family N-acetyltransferase [Chloroflexota bacterium]
MTAGRRPVAAPPVEVVSDATRRSLARHEARVAALAGRRFVDLGDAVLVHDEGSTEPWRTWLGDVRWPADTAAFDARLVEAFAMFATMDRRPCIWVEHGTSRPRDLADRLARDGFIAAEFAYRMWLRRADADGFVEATRVPSALDVSVHAGGARDDLDLAAAADAAADVLSVAFRVSHAAVAAEVRRGLAVDGGSLVVVRSGRTVVGAGRSFRLGRTAYLSAIGVGPKWRSRGIGRLVTAILADRTFRQGCSRVHLGVDVGNEPAWRAYAALGFRAVGPPASRFILG